MPDHSHIPFHRTTGTDPDGNPYAAAPGVITIWPHTRSIRDAEYRVIRTRWGALTRAWYNTRRGAITSQAIRITLTETTDDQENNQEDDQ